MVKIYVDEREKPSRVPKYLKEMGATVVFKQLEIGDYIPAEGVIIERKRVDDLIHSVFQGRFFDQLRRLTNSGNKIILLIEGDLLHLDRYTDRHKAIEAALITAAIYNDIPIITTRNARHTAETIKYIAEKMQSGRKQAPKLPTYRKQQKPKDLDPGSWQLYILASFPKIGPTLADRLLKKFGSLKAVINAQPSELARVEGVSEDKAALIKRIAEYNYAGINEKESGLERFMQKKLVKEASDKED